MKYKYVIFDEENLDVIRIDNKPFVCYSEKEARDIAERYVNHWQIILIPIL